MMRLKKTFFASAAALVLSALSAVAGEAWMKEIPAAVELAKEQKKPVFVEFTGSDWCPPCMMMDKNVFSKEEFLEGAQKNFILVKIDVPQADKELREKNEKVLQEYNVMGVPTVILLDPEGKEFSRFGASQFNTVESMLGELERQLRIKDMF